MHLSARLPFLLSLVSTWAFASGHATNKTNAEPAETYECRCGSLQSLSLPRVNITPPSEAKQCSDYKLIDARGTSEPQGVSVGFYPMIKDILAHVPGGVSLSVEYPAGVYQNTTSGEAFVIDTIHKGIKDCPGQKYALFGYSQGATVMLRALERLNHRALDSIKSVILVGNPYRVPGRMSNVDVTGQPDHKTSVGMLVAMPSGNDTTIPRLSPEMDKSGKVLDFCLDNDVVCSYNPACSCLIAASHLFYGVLESIQESGIKHVVSRLKN